MAFNIYKVVRVQRETSPRRLQKHGMSTQKYHFKNVKYSLKNLDSRVSFDVFQPKIIHRYLFTVLVCELTPC